MAYYKLVYVTEFVLDVLKNWVSTSQQHDVTQTQNLPGPKVGGQWWTSVKNVD